MGIAMEGGPAERKNHQGILDEMEMKVAKFSWGKAANLGVGLLLSCNCIYGILALIVLPALLLIKEKNSMLFPDI
jgi:hypothetical protein